MRWHLYLERRTENSLNHDIARRHLQEIAEAASRNKTFSFKGRVPRQLPDPEEIFDGQVPRKRYLVKFLLEESKARTPEIAQERYLHIKEVIEKCARNKGWTLLAEQPVNALTDEPGPLPAMPRTPFRPIDLASVLRTSFADIYDREPHLRIINDAIQTAVLTSNEVRAHTILYGLPGGCKSSLIERIKILLDDDFERVKIMDASTMTKAGLEQWILKRAPIDGQPDDLPEIMVFEEIEKVDNKDNLKCLGSIMASGYMQRTNARIGNAQVRANFLVLATCNDEEGLKEFMRGYLWDRFANQLYCPLPSEAIMRRILIDKINRIPQGRPEWADKAMELARCMRVQTPRTIIGYLAGRDRLLQGEYQRDVLAIARAKSAEDNRLGS